MELDIQTGITEVLNRNKKVMQQHVNRISALDNPCLRQLYYMRHDWDKAAPTNDSLQGIFETGHILEPVIERIVSEIGQLSSPAFRIVGSQISTNDNLFKEYQISGTIDGFLQIKNNTEWHTAGVIDIKTSSPNIFPQLHDYSSLSRYPWTRSYRGQLMLYGLAHNLDTCFILFVNKANLYEMKLIDFPLDMAYCDLLLEKAKTVNKAIETETPPIGVNDPDTCPRCKFFSFCCPDISTGGNLQISDNTELEQILDRMEELDPAVTEYKELEVARNGILVKGQDIAIADWLILWSKVEVTKKPQTGGTFSYWRKKIIKKTS